MSAPPGYSRAQITLHWAIAALVGFQVFSGGRMEAAFADRLSGAVPNEPYPTPHAVVGGLILALVLARLGLRLARGVPAPPPSEHPALALVARATHALFYALLIAMPLSGAVA